MTIDSKQQAIGVFDSGVGGLSVLRAICRELPDESIVYFADQAHVPYGPRLLDEVRCFSEAITRFLLGCSAKVIVVACNTASAAALQYLRAIFPEIVFVGMEPAIKPAVEQTQTRKVGVLATPATFQGALYASVVERFAAGVELMQHTCPGLVAQIEKGVFDDLQTEAILQEALLPMLQKGIDTIVLGCTHYPFVIPLIQKICGPNIRVIDPAPSIARQTRRVLEAKGLLENKNRQVRYFTSGDEANFTALLPRFCNFLGPIQSVVWQHHQDQNLVLHPNPHLSSAICESR